MKELKKCPFCGSEVEIFDNHKDFFATEKQYAIRCKNRTCGLYMTFVFKRYSKTRMIDAWNKRKLEKSEEE